MRHQKRINKIGRNASHRKATLANLASSLIEHKRIKTTHSKAKAMQRFIEPLITKAKKGTLHDRRNVLKLISRPNIVAMLFDEISPKFKDRNGGYTRITKLGFRNNDAASVSLIEFVTSSEDESSSSSEVNPKDNSK